jgi:hypothetical protein
VNTAMKSEGLCVGGGACTGRGFDQHAMLALVEGVLTDGKASGFGLTRFWANMEWALEEHLGVHNLVEYETRLNYRFPTYDDVVGCTHDLTRVAPVS